MSQWLRHCSRAETASATPPVVSLPGPPIFGILFAVLVFFAAHWLPTIAAAATSEEESDLATGRLTVARWEAGAFSRSLSGACCWLIDSTGFARLEILAWEGNGPTAADELVDLLDQKGSGWTVILTGPAPEADGPGTLNAWGESWRTIDPSLAVWSRLLVAVLNGDRPLDPEALPAGCRVLHFEGVSRSRPRFMRANASPVGPATLRIQVPRLTAGTESSGDAPATFRQRSVARGAGRGGYEEILTVVRGADVGDGMELRSSRRVGSLRIQEVVYHSVEYPSFEVFVPLWPLRQLVRFRQ